MGNKIFSSLNSKKSDKNSQNNSSNDNSEQNIIKKTNEERDKLIPYSYTPQPTKEELLNKNGTLKCFKVIRSHEKWCNCLIFLKSGNLCSCSGDKSINVYSNDNKYNVILSIKSCHNDFILYILELYQSIIASASSDGKIKFWKLILKSNNINNNNYIYLGTISAHESDVWKIVFIRKNNQLISCGSDTFIKIWDLKFIKDNNTNDIDEDKNNKVNEINKVEYTQRKILCEHKYWVSSIIQVINKNLNINYLVSGSGDNTIKFYDISNNYNFVHSMDKVICCQQGTLINYTNKKLLIGGGRGILFYVVNFVHFQVESKIFGGNEEINTILVLRKNKFIKKTGFILGGKERCFHYVSENEYIDKIIKEDTHEKYIYCIIQLNDNFIASSSYDNAIKIWKYDENTFT